MVASNTENFNNESSAPHKHSGHGKWMMIHGVLMLGMMLPMIAVAAPAGAATLGDAAVQGLHMVSSMISGITQHLDVVADIASNTFGGEFAAHTMEAAPMHGAEMAHAGMAHGGGAAEAAMHAGHIGAEAQLTQFDQWLNALSPQELAEIQGEAKDVYGMSLRRYHELNVLQHGP